MGQHINTVLSKGRTDPPSEKFKFKQVPHYFLGTVCLHKLFMFEWKKIINQKNSQPDLSWEISQNEKHRAYIFPLHETRSVTPCEEAAVLTCQPAWSSQSTPSSKSCLL